MELSFDQLGSEKTNWSQDFWTQCKNDTPCYPLTVTTQGHDARVGTTLEAVKHVYEELSRCFGETSATTDVDARHETVFGLALFCVGILQELMRISVSQSIMGRLALRTIGEAFITLSYLIHKDDPELWRSYRVFGSGQAKLSYLKLEEAENIPKYVDINTLQNFANEDVWQEFLTINLGHWEKANLRKLSEDAGVKDSYDHFYSWTSTFTHAHWGAVRSSVFDNCGNPLHRLHRIPASIHTLPDVLHDACTYVDQILEIVSRAYPTFSAHVSVTTE